MAIGVLSSSIVISVTSGSNINREVQLGPITFSEITTEAIPLVGLVILLLFISKAAISIFLTHQLAHSLARIEARAAKKIAKNAFGEGLEGVRRYSKDEILYTVQVGSPGAFNTLLNSVATLSAEGFLFLLVIGSFTVINPLAALGAITYFAIVGILIQYFIGQRVQQAGEAITQSAIKSSAGILDLSEVIREASTLQKKGFFIEKIYKARVTSSRNVATQLVLQGAPRHIVETALIVGIALFIFLQSLSGDLATAAGTIGVFLVGGLRLTAALLPLQNAFLSINQCRPGAERALGVLEQSSLDSPDNLDEYQIPTTAQMPVAVSLEDVCFSYPGNKNVLTNISLNIPPGSQAAFIGPSGAGKSTLADLILGLLSPSSGKVCIDGRELPQWVEANPESLGYVPQKPGMISGTIRENIALGVDPARVDNMRLERAINDAHLGALISSLSEGVETDIGKQKDGLSGGQLQRIGLARALYFEPSLLIMDEATSALDAESENEINKALNEMKGRVTVILIAHRLNTVQRSDVVFLLEQGRVTASGTFSELLKSNSTVKNLAHLMSIDQV
jgi:ATP-binding cassette subfamily C protein